MNKLIVANYKMNGSKDFFMNVHKSLKKIKKDTELVLCPPFIYLHVLKNCKFYKLGAQDVCNKINTKSTGQISPKMLKEFNVSYSIVGHSERRANGETDSQVADKTLVCVENGITPIVCVGEQTKNSSISILTEQVNSVLEKVNSNIVFAYEPVWAIGSGETPTNAQINKAVTHIKTCAKKHKVEVKVLYGGSVNEKNYKELLNTKADGFLLGGVTLDIDKFIQIVKGV